MLDGDDAEMSMVRVELPVHGTCVAAPRGVVDFEYRPLLPVRPQAIGQHLGDDGGAAEVRLDLHLPHALAPRALGVVGAGDLSLSLSLCLSLVFFMKEI